jgi:hypothetical protein
MEKENKGKKKIRKKISRLCARVDTSSASCSKINS